MSAAAMLTAIFPWACVRMSKASASTHLLREVRMTPRMNRRQILRGAGAMAAAIALGGRRSAAAATAKVHETRVISQLPDRYHGWPTLARRANGQLLFVCSGGREAHVCPFG